MPSREDGCPGWVEVGDPKATGVTTCLITPVRPTDELLALTHSGGVGDDQWGIDRRSADRSADRAAQAVQPLIDLVVGDHTGRSRQCSVVVHGSQIGPRPSGPGQIDPDVQAHRPHGIGCLMGSPRPDGLTQTTTGFASYRRNMTTTAAPGHLLQGNFAQELPELAVPWQAADAPEPRLLALNEDLATELGLDLDFLRSEAGTRFLLGNEVPDQATPVAQGYAGHQFGTYVPRLGDGRALLLGEITDSGGQLRDLHLKGSGPTPFARGGDGLAAVGPMLREYLIREALHALGVPTTRSLAVVATGTTVQRERPLPGAVLARVAASHLRVGTFQYARATGDVEVLRRLADHAITRHHPAAAQAENPYLALLEAVLSAQAELVAKWMLIGLDRKSVV